MFHDVIQVWQEEQCQHLHQKNSITQNKDLELPADLNWNIFTLIEEKPQTLVFVNGWMLRLSCWRAQMRDHEGNGLFPKYNILFANNRGHGRVGLGDSSPRTYISNCAHDISELMDQVGAGAFHIVAHSMGGVIGTELHAQRL
jgi:pimeloyl-ACP methyl ester carboxylesterase